MIRRLEIPFSRHSIFIPYTNKKNALLHLIIIKAKAQQLQPQVVMKLQVKPFQHHH